VILTDYIDRGLRIRPDGVCVSDATGRHTLTYRDVAALSHRVAAALRQDGIETGDKVAILSPNDVTAFVCVVGTLRAGATWVALNPRSEVDELGDLLEHVGCHYLMHHADQGDRSLALLGRAPTIRGDVVFGGEAEGAFEAWLAPAGTRMPRPPVTASDAAMIMGSGGTTGRPKAVPITHRQYFTMNLAFNAHMCEPEPPVYLLATPMTHAAGVSAWPVLAEGGTIVVQDGVRAGAIFEAIERHRVTRLFLPPTAIYALLSDAAVRDVDFSSLRHLIYAAAPMSGDRLADALDVFGPVMAQTFGQAEAPMICTVMTPREHVDAARDERLSHRLASCGRPSLVARVEVMGDDGQLLGPGGRGEIVVRGDLVMDGYYRDAGATAEALRPGGWHGTGDVGYRDEDGFVYIVDRKRDMIITGGFNVYPSAVERVLWSHPAVLDCAVTGVPDEKWGETVTAVVELKDGETVTAEEIIALCKARLGSVQAPKTVLFRELPRSSNGKVLKRRLRDEFWYGRVRMV
jgi:acyl-CoA synthetase (AMP-forming)/AMP-acid ligase II